MIKVIGCDEWPKQKANLTAFGEALNLKSIHYTDGGKNEQYVLTTKTGRIVKINVSGNQYDGGFMGTEVLK